MTVLPEIRAQLLEAAFGVEEPTGDDPRRSSSPARSRHVLGLIPAALAILLAVGIGAAALVVLHHGGSRPSQSASSVGTRGEIVDRHGLALAGTTRVAAISVAPAALPESRAGRVRVYDRLARALGIHAAADRCVLNGRRWLGTAPCPATSTPSSNAGSEITIADGVQGTQAREVAAEHLPGVSVRWGSIRSYPGDLAAQALGLVTPVGSDGAAAGRSGLEASYDRYLRAGDTLGTSIDANLQRVGETALKRSERANDAPGGAFVAMNPDNGQIYAMGSSPTYDASSLSRRLSAVLLRRLAGPDSSLFDRATQSAGPTGSLFKPVTALAALASGEWATDSVFDDNGQFCVGTGAYQQCRHNAGNAVEGKLDLVDALRVSSDDFFFNLGARLNEDPARHPDGGPLDEWARNFGIGRPTGVDLPAEASGTLPSPAWRQQRNALEAECDNATGPFAFTNGTATSAHNHPGWRRSPKHPPGGCGIADGTNRPWSIGDNESLAVGQGDVQATPLQVAVAYAALANGGTVVRPHLGLEVKTPNGSVLRTISPAPARHLTIAATNLHAIRQGLHEAAQSPGGTSDDVMGSFPMTVYGKAGSAQYVNQPDSAWYAGFVIDHTNRPIVVVVRIEKGGFGDVAAAPVARQLLSQWFFGKPGTYKPGTSSTL